jgi:hypothetical protein
MFFTSRNITLIEDSSSAIPVSRIACTITNGSRARWPGAPRAAWIANRTSTGRLST